MKREREQYLSTPVLKKNQERNTFQEHWKFNSWIQMNELPYQFVTLEELKIQMNELPYNYFSIYVWFKGFWKWKMGDEKSDFLKENVFIYENWEIIDRIVYC